MKWLHRAGRGARRAVARAMVFVAMGAALLANGGSSLAQPSAADKETARAAWMEGHKKQKAGDHVGALKLFRAAHALMGLPMTGIDVARELAALGQVVEARDAALGVAKMTASSADKRLVSEARSLYESLGKRLGTILLTVTGAPASGARVRVDGLEVPADSVEVPRKVNPGSHAIDVDADGCQSVSQTVSITEGGSERVAILLVPSPPKPTSGNTPEPAAPQGPHETVPQAAMGMIGKYVVLTTKEDKIVEGLLVSADDTGFVVRGYDGDPVSIERAQAHLIHLREDTAPDPPPKAQTPAPEAQTPSAGANAPSVGVHVHIDSNDPGVVLYRHGGSAKTAIVTGGIGISPTGQVIPVASFGTATVEERAFVCRTPCDTIVDGSLGQEFFLAVGDTPIGGRFLLRGVGSKIVLSAQIDSRPSVLKKGVGAGLLAASAGPVIAGSSVLALGRGTDGDKAAGGTCLALAGLMILVGIPLLVSGVGSYDVRVPQTVGRTLSPTAVAVMPPLPFAGASAGPSLSATWQF